MSPSFSLTALDTHRVSNGSVRNMINVERKASQTSGLVNPGSRQSQLLMIQQHSPWPRRPSKESFSDDRKSNSGSYQALAMHKQEVNANSEDPKAVTCLLLKDTPKMNGVDDHSDLQCQEEENQL